MFDAGGSPEAGQGGRRLPQGRWQTRKDRPLPGAGGDTA